MSESVVRGNGWTVTVTTEPIEVYSNTPERDENWAYTDAAGNEHHYAPEYPTLVWVEDPGWYCEEHNEVHEAGHWECPLCGEHIVPGTKPPSPFPRYIAGPIDARLVLEDGRGFALRDEDLHSTDIAATVRAILADPGDRAQWRESIHFRMG